MTLPELEMLLKSVCPNTYELAAPPGISEYIVWQQYGVRSVAGDNSFYVDAPEVQLDLITQNPPRALQKALFAALRAARQPYSVVSVGYDDEYAAYRCIIEMVVI